MKKKAASGNKFEFPLKNVRARESALERMIHLFSDNEWARFMKELVSAATAEDPTKEMQRVLTAWYRTALLRSEPSHPDSIEWARTQTEASKPLESIDDLRDRLGLPKPAVQ